MMETKRGLSAALAAALGSAGFAGVAVAQQGAGPVLEEVVVTARRYTESINDAPLAVAVMSDDYLRDQGVTGIQDIIELTPGATWTEFTKAQPAFSLRGQRASNFGNSSIESSVQLVIDGAAVTKAFMMSPPVYDLERVEVMRGPQGTTFGRNASIGLMHFVTKRPTDEFEAGVNLSAGTLDLFGVDGFISGSLSDTVSGRVAFNIREQDGVMEDALTGDALDSYSNESIRASLLIEPSDTFSAFLKAEFNHDDDDPPVRRGESCTVPTLTNPPYTGLQAITGQAGDWIESCDPWTTLNTPGFDFFTERDMTTLVGELVWDVGEDITITSLTSYMDGDHETFQDAFGTPAPILNQIVRNDADSFTTELRIDNAASGDAFRWLVGAYFLDDEEFRFEDNWSWPTGGARNFSDSHLQTISNTETESFAVFGELGFDLTDRLNLTIGGRFTDDARDYLFEVVAWGRADDLTGVGAGGPRACADFQVAPEPGRAGGPVCGSEANPMGIDPTPVSNDWDNFSGKVSLSYALNDNSNIYALFSEGFKGGGFQHDARNVAQLQNFLVNEEEATNLELGWKGSYDRARFAATLFSMEVEGSQVNALVPIGNTGAFTTVIQNAGAAETDGFEFEGTWLATDALSLGGSLAIYDAQFKNTIVNSMGAVITDPNEQGAEVMDGQRPQDAVDDTYTLWGEYEFALSSGATLMLRADVQHRSDVWGRIPGRSTLLLDGSGPAYLRPDFDNVGVSVRWTSASGATSVNFWGRNVLDEFDWKNVGPPTGRTNMNTATRAFVGREQYGVDVNFTF